MSIVQPLEEHGAFMEDLSLEEEFDRLDSEIRRELDYLADRCLVTLDKQPSGKWFADLTRYGTDIAEYTIDCAPGIARPVKYW